MALQISPEVRAIMRRSAAELEPYDPGFSPVEVNLSANENTYGMPEAVRRAINDALSQTTLNRYPVPLADKLRQKLADWHGVDPSQVCVGNGGDELLFNLFLAFGGPGRTLLNSTPTFSVYSIYAGLVDTPIVNVERDPETFAPNQDELLRLAPQSNIVVLTSPNNPTGDIVDKDFVDRLCRACPGIVLLDEAYGEFAPTGSTCEPLLESHPNLVVLHTLSKAFAFAGGRLGYVLADPSVVGALAAVRQPYTVDVLVQAAAEVIVDHRHDFLPTIGQIKSERERLLEGLGRLSDLGVKAWPSCSNFVCVRVPDAPRVWTSLRDDHSILVRNFSATPGLHNCLRITVGTPAENDRVLAALRTILQED